MQQVSKKLPLKKYLTTNAFLKLEKQVLV